MFLLLSMLLFFLLIGVYIYKELLNPITLFNGVWFVTLGLYSLGLSFYPSELNMRGLQAFILMIISYNFVFLYLVILKLAMYNKKKSSRVKNHKKISAKGVKVLYKIWIILILFEVIYFKGFPVLWILCGVPKTYADFGIPSIHGFINSLAWVIITSAFCHYLDKEKEKRQMLNIMFIMGVVYALLLARQALITGFVQMLTIYLLKRKIKLVKMLPIVCLAILLFGLLGNFRSGAEHFKVVAGITSNLPDYLYGVYWVLMYVTTPIGNINNLVSLNINFFHGLASIRSILPSVIAGIIFKDIKVKNINFYISSAFNVSTFLQVPYQDFGMIGIVLISAFYGLLGFCFWENYLRDKNNPESILLYAVCFQLISMSFFVNMLFMLPIIIQFFYIKLFFKFNIISKNNIKMISLKFNE